MPKYKVPNEKHFEHKWLVQKLAADFELVDLWEYPISFKPAEKDTLYQFRKHAVEPTLKNVFNFSPTGLLFHFRTLMGKIFRLDEKVNQLPIPGSAEISLADRMSAAETQSHSSELDIDLRTDNYFNFQTVYSFENETMHELSNATEHTLMHYTWVPKKDGTFRVQMASYVKHRNKFGAFYMSLITPFKYWVVYPYLFDGYVKKWNKYKKNKV